MTASKKPAKPAVTKQQSQGRFPEKIKVNTAKPPKVENYQHLVERKKAGDY